MIPLTIAVAVVVGALALRVSRPAALALLICSMMLYPDSLRVPMGPIKMSAPRLVAIVLLTRVLIQAVGARAYRFHVLDGLVLLEWVWSVTANILAGSGQMRMNEIIGRVFDSVLMYFTARLCILRNADWRQFVGPMTLCAVAAGGMGAAESIRHSSPYEWLRQYSTIGFDFGITPGGPAGLRFGLLRAQLATAMPIYFGMAMMIITGMIFAARGYAKRKVVWVVGTVGGIAGVLSSMSSGPQSALAVWVMVLVMSRFPRLIKPGLIAFVCFLIFCEFASNRHVWYLIEYVNPLGGDSWYRSQLITVAITQWRDYGLIGVGDGSVRHWGMLVDGRIFVDLVNEYVLVAINSGLVGLFIRVGIQAVAIRECVRMYRRGDADEKRLAFGLAATLLAVMMGGMSVGSFGPPLLLGYILLGTMICHRRVGEVVPPSGKARRRRRRRLVRRAAYWRAGAGGGVEAPAGGSGPSEGGGTGGPAGANGPFGHWPTKPAT